MIQDYRKRIYGTVIKLLKTFDLPREEYLTEKQAMHDYLFGASICKYARLHKLCGITQDKCSHVTKQQLCSHYEAMRV